MSRSSAPALNTVSVAGKNNVDRLKSELCSEAETTRMVIVRFKNKLLYLFNPPSSKKLQLTYWKLSVRSSYILLLFQVSLSFHGFLLSVNFFETCWEKAYINTLTSAWSPRYVQYDQCAKDSNFLLRATVVNRTYFINSLKLNETLKSLLTWHTAPWSVCHPVCHFLGTIAAHSSDSLTRRWHWSG